MQMVNKKVQWRKCQSACLLHLLAFLTDFLLCLQLCSLLCSVPWDHQQPEFQPILQIQCHAGSFAGCSANVSHPKQNVRRAFVTMLTASITVVQLKAHVFHCP